MSYINPHAHSLTSQQQARCQTASNEVTQTNFSGVLDVLKNKLLSIVKQQKTQRLKQRYLQFLATLVTTHRQLDI